MSALHSNLCYTASIPNSISLRVIRKSVNISLLVLKWCIAYWLFSHHACPFSRSSPSILVVDYFLSRYYLCELLFSSYFSRRIIRNFLMSLIDYFLPHFFYFVSFLSCYHLLRHISLYSHTHPHHLQRHYILAPPTSSLYCRPCCSLLTQSRLPDVRGGVVWQSGRVCLQVIIQSSWFVDVKMHSIIQIHYLITLR